MNAPLHPARALQPGAIQALIFDCDGTLVDSETPSLAVLRALAGVEGLILSREEADQRFRGVRMAHCIAWIASQLEGKPASFEADFIKQVRAATELRFRESLQTLPGAAALLSGLRLPFCVASNGPRAKIELTLSLTGLRPFFGERVFSAYEVGSFEPEPGLFLHAAAAMGHAPEACAVVEDSLTGVRAGLAAGMQVFTLLAPEALPGELAGRVTCIAGLAELAPALRRQHNKNPG